MRRSVSVIGLLPASSLLAGALAGLAWPWAPRLLLMAMAMSAAAAGMAYVFGWTRAAVVALVAGFAACGAANAAGARDRAIDTSLRRALDTAFGGFSLDSLGPAGAHDPVRTRARLLEDASVRDGYASLSLAVEAVRLGDAWHASAGHVRLSVTGTPSPDALSAWRAGRTIEAPVSFRRAARFLNDGVPDFERELALDGTTLLGSVKSGLLVDVVGRGTRLDEAAAAGRARIREAVTRWVGARSATSAALVTAVLIGDRAAIPDNVRDTLRAAGTYHVIAISGGNIAVFVVLVSALGALAGLGPRPAAALTIGVLLAYAALVVSGPSVRRAVLVAVVYLSARTIDHRAPAWHAASIACGGVLVAWPLDLLDAGFVLTFGAAAALLAASPVVRGLSLAPPLRALLLAVAASAAVEAVLLPVQALVFARVSLAGIALNLIAVPMMAVAQIGGLAVVALDLLGASASWPAWAADIAVKAVLGSGRVVEAAPWLPGPVRPPPAPIVAVYYVALAVATFARRGARAAGFAVWVVTATIVLAGSPEWLRHVGRGFSPADDFSPAGPQARDLHTSGHLRVTMLDVGQAEAILLEPPSGGPVLIDAGGSPFGSGLDVGARVVTPALWARGVNWLSALLVTHGDPDHLGGVPGVLAHMAVREGWLGIAVPGHAPGEALIADLRRHATPVRSMRAGDAVDRGGVRWRVLHPPEPDWERRRIRNDDSVVLEVVLGDVAMLFTGDVGAAVERAIVPRLTAAPIRVLKVAHHGSRTSTSRELLEAWRPQLALISAGRGNTFGHPAPDVVRRLEAVGARVLRTDRDGQITVTTDGRRLWWRTFVGGEGWIAKTLSAR